MRIVLVSPYDFPYPGGVTEHISHLARGLLAMGHEVHIMAPSSTPEEMGAYDGAVLHPVGRVVPVPANGSVARISLSLRLSRQVKQILAENQFDIVHLHEPLMPALPLTVLRHSNATNVGTFHAFRQSNIATYFYAKPVLRYFFRKLHGLIAVSPAARDFVASYFRGDYKIIPNGIDYHRFRGPRPPVEWMRDGKLNVLFVGRLEKRKGLKYLLRAWPLVRREFPSARLVVVGSGRPLEAYRKFVASQGMAEVVFTGYLPSEELIRHYHSSDVFCAPSTGQESFGIVLLEAMATGVPIVATNIPGYQKVVTHGREGLLVEPNDEVGLAMALGHLLADSQLRASMGGRGRETAAKYAWDKVAAQIADYYEETTAQRLASSAVRKVRFRRVRQAAAGVAHLLSR